MKHIKKKQLVVIRRLLLISIIICIIIMILQVVGKKENIELTPELARSKSYDVVRRR